MAKNLSKMYITYINPYTSGILLLYNNFTMEQYTLVANWHLYAYTDSYHSSSIYDSYLNEKIRTVVQGDVIKGTWSNDNDIIFLRENGTEYCIQEESPTIDCKGLIFYKIQDVDLIAKIFVELTSAINFNAVYKQAKENAVINPDGFGKGSVFKNFNLSQEITLS